MTRIISGFAGSIELKVPPNTTRPTSSRVREALFSALEARNRIEAAHVLDLFAGSGALGLEAASRGAAHVVCVEHNSKAASICKSNAQKVLKQPHATVVDIQVHTQSVERYLDCSDTKNPPFSLVFIDPPYGMDDSELSRNLNKLVGLVDHSSNICVERAIRSRSYAPPASFEIDRVSTYGDTCIFWLRLSQA